MTGYGVKTNEEFPLMQHPYSEYLRNQVISYINGEGVHQLSNAYDELLKSIRDFNEVTERPSPLEERMSEYGIKREF